MTDPETERSKDKSEDVCGGGYLWGASASIWETRQLCKAITIPGKRSCGRGNVITVHGSLALNDIYTDISNTEHRPN